MKKAKNGCHKNVALALGAVLAMGLAGGLKADQGGAEVLAKLNLAPAAARESVLDSLARGSVYNETAIKAFKALPAPARVAIVRAGLAWIKSYVATEEFRAAYAQRRELEKPEAPAAPPSADDEQNKMKAEMEKSIAEMRQSMAAMDAQTKKEMEAAIRALRDQIQRMEKDEGQRTLMRQAGEMTAAEDRKRHEGKLEEWEQRYPADPRLLIRRRIREFLAASAGVDFTAKLMPRGDKMVFANEAYEQKPAEWKLCFRAGKEATATARAFAEVWLAELDKN